MTAQSGCAHAFSIAPPLTRHSTLPPAFCHESCHDPAYRATRTLLSHRVHDEATAKPPQDWQYSKPPDLSRGGSNGSYGYGSPARPRTRCGGYASAPSSQAPSALGLMDASSALGLVDDVEDMGAEMGDADTVIMAESQPSLRTAGGPPHGTSGAPRLDESELKLLQRFSAA